MIEAAAAVYRLALSLWVGGMAAFSFVLTPVIFRTQPREAAARVVGALFPVYFRYGLAVVAVAFAARLAGGWGLSGPQQTFGTVLLAAALGVFAWQAYVLVPRMERVRAKIPSFDPADAHDPARREFGRLHALSMTLNFLLMAEGAVLIAAQEAFSR